MHGVGTGLMISVLLEQIFNFFPSDTRITNLLLSGVSKSISINEKRLMYSMHYVLKVNCNENILS